MGQVLDDRDRISSEIAVAVKVLGFTSKTSANSLSELSASVPPSRHFCQAAVEAVSELHVELGCCDDEPSVPGDGMFFFDQKVIFRRCDSLTNHCGQDDWSIFARSHSCVAFRNSLVVSDLPLPPIVRLSEASAICLTACSREENRPSIPNVYRGLRCSISTRGRILFSRGKLGMIPVLYL